MIPNEPPEPQDPTLNRIARLAGFGLQRQGRLARGGMAVVDAVVDPVLQRRIARKVLAPELMDNASAVALFVREAHVTAQLDHPNIVPVHELGLGPDGRPWFTMKLVEGQTLEEWISRRGAQPRDPEERSRLLEVMLRICDALELAHSRGIVHCDLKPLNVMVGDFGQVYVMDWGIAQMVTPARLMADPGATQESPVVSFVPELPIDGVMGTPAYMAPEQATADVVDERTDVFALGALLYFLLAGRAPFQHEDPMEAMRLAARVGCTPLTELDPSPPSRLAGIVARAMSREPADRYPDVESFAAAVRGFLRGVDAFPRIAVPAGEHVVREGEDGDAAYVIVSGRCQVYTTRSGRHAGIAELGSGEVFGETAILAASTRTASVVAVDDCTLLRITRARWDEALADTPQWLQAFTRTLAKRFAEQMEGTEAPRRLRPGQVIDLALMCVQSHGEPAPDGGHAIAWSELAERLGAFGIGRRALAVGLGGVEGVELDVAADWIHVPDVARVRALLAR